MGSSVDLPTSVAAPLPAEIKADICSTPNSQCNGSGSAIIRQSVELRADSSVVLDSGESRIVAIDGNDYRVQVLAHRATTGAKLGSCQPDYYPENDTLLLVNAFAADLESRIQDLDRSELPDCIHGNDPPADVGFSLYEVPISTIYEGPVFFRSFEPSNNRDILFDVPALPPSGSVPPSLGIAAPPETFDPPAAGTEYWAEYSLDVATLREAQRGPIVFASIFSLVPFSESIESQLSLALGIGVFAERRCDYDYGAETIALWDLVFETDPPTRVRSGQINDLTYDGHDYSVWFWSEGIVHFSISVARALEAEPRITSGHGESDQRVGGLVEAVQRQHLSRDGTGSVSERGITEDALDGCAQGWRVWLVQGKAGADSGNALCV